MGDSKDHDYFRNNLEFLEFIFKNIKIRNILIFFKRIEQCLKQKQTLFIIRFDEKTHQICLNKISNILSTPSVAVLELMFVVLKHKLYDYIKNDFNMRYQLLTVNLFERYK